MRFHRWIAALLAAGTLGAQAAVLSWLPSFKQTGHDELGFVDLLYTRQAGERLGGFDLLLQFNPTVLSFSAADSLLTPANRPGFGTTPPDQLACPGVPGSCIPWGSVGGITGQDDPDDGTIRLLEVSLAPADGLDPQAVQFLLARLAFIGIGSIGQSSTLELLRADLADAQGDPLPVRLLSGARIEIAEPGSAGLAAAALLVLGASAARRRRR